MLNKFYEKWSHKSDLLIGNDIASAIRKSERISAGLRKIKDSLSIHTIIDFGCGYGAVLHMLSNFFGAKNGYGFDCSKFAIEYAKNKYGRDNLAFYTLSGSAIEENIQFMKEVIPNKTHVDCVLLIDVLEHIPDCRTFMFELSRITKYFIVKLPIESSIFDNYILPKQYPGSTHSNGHLREFTVNDVYYFIRKLGLVPLFEDVYIYDIHDTVPPQENKRALAQLKYSLLRLFKVSMSYILPKRIFLRLIGGGGYWCIATFNQEFMLDP